MYKATIISAVVGFGLGVAAGVIGSKAYQIGKDLADAYARDADEFNREQRLFNQP